MKCHTVEQQHMFTYEALGLWDKKHQTKYNNVTKWLLHLLRQKQVFLTHK